MTPEKLDEVLKHTIRLVLKWVETDTIVLDKEGGTHLPDAVLSLKEGARDVWSDVVVDGLKDIGIVIELKSTE